MKKDAEQFEVSLQQAAQGAQIEGRLAPLVHTAQLVSSLAELPPPPNQLASGRRLFLAEAARLRATRTTQTRAAWGLATVRPVGILVAAVLVFGILFGLGQAVAASLPGEALYGFKLTTEAMRVQWTASPESRADLAAALVEKRLDEIVSLVEQGQVVDELTADRAKDQLALALQAVSQVSNQEKVQAALRLESILLVQQQAMMHAASSLSESQQELMRDLLEEISRVRRELRTGQEESGGEQFRLRPNMPLDTQDTQDPGWQPGHVPGSQPDQSPVAPVMGKDADSGPGPQPDNKPAGREPAGSPSPQPDSKPARPNPTGVSGSGPSPQRDDGSDRQKPTRDPGPVRGPQSDDKPAEPQPKEDPNPDPGPHSDDKPSGSESNEVPDASPSPQAGGDPGSAPGQQPTDPAGGQDSEPPHDPGTGGGSRKP